MRISVDHYCLIMTIIASFRALLQYMERMSEVATFLQQSLEGTNDSVIDIKEAIP